MVTKPNELSIDHAIAAGHATDGAPVKKADEVVPGDLLILDWPAYIVAEVVHVYRDAPSSDSGVAHIRFHVVDADEERRAPDGGSVAFIARLAHEYVRVKVSS